jgi:hypothetical protein
MSIKLSSGKEMPIEMHKARMVQRAHDWQEIRFVLILGFVSPVLMECAG